MLSRSASSAMLCVSMFAGLALASDQIASAQSVSLLRTFDDPTVTERDLFGTSVAIDGNVILIGAPGDKSSGATVGQAHLFDAKSGGLLRTFSDPTRTNVDVFGTSVALDGGYVLIGAPGDDTKGSDVGQAHLFDAATGSLLQTFNDPTVTIEDRFGWSVAIDGNHVLISDYSDDTDGTEVGQVHLFDVLSGNLLQTFSDPTITREDLFGFSVAMDGDYVLVGAPFDSTSGTRVGQAHLFDVASGNLLYTYNDPTPTGQDRFGNSVAIDGDRVLVGAPRDDSNGRDVGQAHLFDVLTGSLLQNFDDPAEITGGQLGFAVAIDGNRVVVGAPYNPTYLPAGGHAHVFDANTGRVIQTLSNPDTDNFGSSVAINSQYVLIGVRGDDTYGFNVGQTHLYLIVPEPDAWVLGAGCMLSILQLRYRSPWHS